MDYSKAKIYKILNTVNDSCYIGSTCQPLSKRMAKHRSVMNNDVKKGRKLYTSMRELGADKFYIELIIELDDTQNVEQLRKVEGEYIRQLGTLNMTIAGRCRKQWNEEHKEHLKALKQQSYIEHKEERKEQHKKYKEEHREDILQKQRDYYKNNLDKRKTYLEENDDIIKAKYKDYYEKKKHEIKECETCGHSYSRVRQSKHFNSKKHQHALNNLNYINDTT